MVCAVQQFGFKMNSGCANAVFAMHTAIVWSNIRQYWPRGLCALC